MTYQRSPLMAGRHGTTQQELPAGRVDFLSDERGTAKVTDNKVVLKRDFATDGERIKGAFAVAREAAYRVLGQKPYKVQIIGAIVLHTGSVAEMKTGEGKTLVATLPAYLNAIAGKGVHVVTVNDYLARRDAEWMTPLLEALGLTVGWITADSTAEQRRVAYECDITYASVNEIGFDVLRDQLATSADDLVSPNPDVAIIDEADSVLVDEALVPLVLAGSEGSTQATGQITEAVSHLDEGRDYTIDAEVRDVIYMGDILRARMKVAGSDDFVMKFRNTLGQTRLQPGQHIRIGWNPQDARALDPV